MGPFILILLIAGSSGRAVDHIEFPNQQSCNFAGKSAAEKAESGKWSFAVHWLCVPRDIYEEKRP